MNIYNICTIYNINTIYNIYTIYIIYLIYNSHTIYTIYLGSVSQIMSLMNLLASRLSAELSGLSSQRLSWL